MANQPIKQNSTKVAKKDNQAKFLEMYAKCYGNITQACRLSGLDRGTFYAWKDDEDFQQKLAEVRPDEIFVDFAENALVGRIGKGDTTAIIFALKTKGRSRGYVEKQEVENTGTQTVIFKKHGGDSSRDTE